MSRPAEDSRSAEIRALHEDYRHEVNEAYSTVVDLELSKRNTEEFVTRYKNNDNYIFIKIFDKSVLSEAEHDGCIDKDA